jgi:mono/diheme cytochrome c family protein
MKKEFSVVYSSKSSGVLILLILLLYGCVHDPFPAVAPPVEVNPEGGGYGGPDCKYIGVCFESSVLPIFQSSCAKSGCHDAATTTDYNLTTYENIIQAGPSKMLKATGLTDEDIMPPPPNIALTKAQRDSIAKWINEGAKNTVKCDCSCDTTKFTYTATINPLMSTYCVSCHNPNYVGGGVLLNTYEGVQAVALNGKLMPSIKHTGPFPMPKGGKLSDCQITQISKWVAGGALKN